MVVLLSRNMPDPAVLHVLTGPTAVGKTELALRWAEENDAEIVSCDSLLFYRGMDIGTAKPTREELGRVPHHLIDVVEPGEAMNIARFVDLAQAAVANILSRRRAVLVTGGSGFYLKAFFGPVTDSVVVPEGLRQELAERERGEGLVGLVAELLTLNPEGLGNLDTANPRRVLRALERCRASGRTLVELRAAFVAMPGPFAAFRVCGVQLTRESADLQERISRRIALMLEVGLVAEVEKLATQGLPENPSAARSIGYRETLAALDGDLSFGELREEIARNTWALVRKQRTWFRIQLPELSQMSAVTTNADQLFVKE
ncbi:MAG: tRNA (adenosine(37)-N6)-dimethylallyltransferase MiaA [Candidatus Synoicihabitans palmerolidicus]|nr:tRNA (adenosine(37)-N6)-dimethylallyltransferase MiaA [Candidatus Synoicihabitans palmerolidicus]